MSNASLLLINKPNLFFLLLQAAQVLPDEVASEQQSLIVVKKLLAIAVSGITYLRGIFPGRAYGSKYVEG